MSCSRPLVPLVAAVALALAGAPAAEAVVPPRDCGSLRVKGKRYNVKADQLRCADAKRHTERYLTTKRRPTGYTCRRYTDTALVFRCARGIRNFFAIRR